MSEFFARLDEKDNLFEILRKFSEILKKISSENCLKCIILAYFSNKLTNYALICCAFGRKTQIVGKFWENFEFFDENSIEKLIFLYFIFYFFENLLLKIEPSEIAPHFFGFGGWISPFPPGYALDILPFSWIKTPNEICSKSF